mgnify:CR=1 FL=1
MPTLKRFTLSTFKHATLSLSLFAVVSAQANNLPVIGDFSSSVISLGSEYSLGQGIVRNIRSSNASIDDPIVISYMQDLTWDLTSTSALQDKRISLEVLKYKSVNAFAAPGGILGFHAGLIVTAENEAQLASVISHELAHLSQRHFAAQLEQQRISSPLAIASMLTGLLAASANPQAGAAILTTGFANQASSQLAFSRRNEQEADRIGMTNLVKAGYDPKAMPEMFNHLLDIQRLQGATPPEFLLTHPTSSARIADTENRAEHLTPRKKIKQSIDFSIIKARLEVKLAQNNKTSLNQFRAQAKASPSAHNQFRLALAYAQNRKNKEALALLKKLPNKWQQHLLVKLSKAEIYSADRQHQAAVKLLKQLNRVYPKHFAVQMVLAKTLLLAGEAKQSIKYLTQVTSYAPDTVDAWYLLAEAYGLSGEKNRLHRARIEYFLLIGQVDAARKQVNYARRERSITKNDSYKLDDLEDQISVVEGYFNTKY